MRIILISWMFSLIFLTSFCLAQGYADQINGSFHKVAFVVTTPNPPAGLEPLKFANAERDLIAKKLNEAGYLVVEYPDQNVNFKNPFEFDIKLKDVGFFAKSSDDPGDVTLFYYLGHGLIEPDGSSEELRIPGLHNGNADKEGFVDLNGIIHFLTSKNKHRVLLLIIDACRDDSTNASDEVSSSDKPKIVTNSDLVLEENATTTGDTANMNLAYLIGHEGLDPDDCVGVIPTAVALKFPRSVGSRAATEQIERAKKELWSYANIDISPFGAAFLMSIKYPNQSLWDLNTNLGKNMSCFTRGGAHDYPVAFTPNELPANILQNYYFGVRRPDNDNVP